MPSIKFFPIIREVLNDLVDSVSASKGLSREEIYERMIAHIKDNSIQWASGKKPVIAYDNVLCRMAYLYEIVPANANLLQNVITYDSEIREYMLGVNEAKGEVSICVFGAGPGTELLALAKWADWNRLDGGLSVNFLLLDKVNEWIDSWEAIKHRIRSNFRDNISKNKRDWPIDFEGSFYVIDICDTTNFGNVNNLFGQDLCILSYVVSEKF